MSTEDNRHALAGEVQAPLPVRTGQWSAGDFGADLGRLPLGLRPREPPTARSQGAGAGVATRDNGWRTYSFTARRTLRAGAARAAFYAEAAAPPPQRDGQSHDSGRSRAPRGLLAHAWATARSTRLDSRQCAAVAGAFVTPLTLAAAGHPLRAHPTGRSAAPGHREAGMSASASMRRDDPHPPRAGRQHMPIATDDNLRLAYAERRPSDRRTDTLAFLERPLT